MKKVFFLLIFILTLVSMIIPTSSPANDASETGITIPVYNLYLPNRGGKTITTPSGWGASNNTVFMGAVIVSPQAYTSDNDSAVVFGFGFGDPVKNIGLQLSANMNDVSEQDNFSYGVKAHRYLGHGTSIAIGGEHLFHEEESDADESFYFSLSHACQKYHSSKPGVSKLHITIGAGSGRFGKKSELDIEHSKGKHGTYVFGAAAYEIFDSANFILEWNGINLNAGISMMPFKNIPFVFTIGALDLTSYSGDGVRFVGAVGLSYNL